MIDIKVLSERDSVRLRPRMYVGDTEDGSGVRRMFLEVLSNSIDAVFGKKDAQIDIISVYPDIIIRDNAEGMPFESVHPHADINAVEVILTSMHSGSTRDGHAPHVHVGYIQGVGLAPINYLSEIFQVKSWRQGELWTCEYQKGICTTRPEIVQTGEGKGTEITFRPDREIFENNRNPENAWKEEVERASYLFPKIQFSFLGSLFYSENGLSDLTKELSPTFSMSTVVGDFIIDLSMGGVAKTETRWQSWVNGSETLLHGSHVLAVKNALKKMNWKPDKVLIHTIGKTVKFAGPTRGELDARDLVEPLSAKILKEFKQETTS